MNLLMTRMDVTLTVFTPAYNRAKLLPRLFESIRKQIRAGHRIEWLIIDDGSTDETTIVLQSFEKEEPHLIKWIRSENGGKHRAINRAAKSASGDWIMLVDSDDYVADGAIEEVLSAIKENNDRKEIGLIRGLRRFPGLETEHRFKLATNPCFHTDWIDKQKAFDSAEVIRKSALSMHPFPEFPGERFMAEGWLWHRLDRTHKTLFINQEWIVCTYQAEGLSANSARIRAMSPLSAMEVYREMFQQSSNSLLRARSAINWWRYRFHALAAGKELRDFELPRGYTPVAALLFVRDRLKLRNT